MDAYEPARRRVSIVDVSNQLLCLFNAEIEQSGEDYVVRVPRREIETGPVEPGEVYRIAVLGRSKAAEGAPRKAPPDQPQPPVEEGEVRYVEIEDLGKQGDGIARVERGYVIIVPGADVGERVKIEITEVKSNFAVGEIIEETFD